MQGLERSAEGLPPRLLHRAFADDTWEPAAASQSGGTQGRMGPPAGLAGGTPGGTWVQARAPIGPAEGWGPNLEGSGEAGVGEPRSKRMGACGVCWRAGAGRREGG